jgi:hypothetical protein
MKTYSYDEIYEMMIFMAKVIKRHGEIYLPIFERIQRELRKAEKRKSSLDYINQITLDGGCQIEELLGNNLGYTPKAQSSINLNNSTT